MCMCVCVHVSVRACACMWVWLCMYHRAWRSEDNLGVSRWLLLYLRQSLWPAIVEARLAGSCASGGSPVSCLPSCPRYPRIIDQLCTIILAY